MYEGVIHNLRACHSVSYVRLADETGFFQWFDEALKKHELRTFVFTGLDEGEGYKPKGWMRLTDYLKRLSLEGGRSFEGAPVTFEEAMLSAFAVDPKDMEAFFLVPQCEASLEDPRTAAWVRRFMDTIIVNERIVRCMIFTGRGELKTAEVLQGHVLSVDERPSQDAEALDFYKKLLATTRSKTEDIERVAPLLKGLSRAQIACAVADAIVTGRKAGVGRMVTAEMLTTFREKAGLPPSPTTTSDPSVSHG